jgi:gluconolactonase
MPNFDLNVEIRHPSVREILPEDGVIEQLATGFGFTEGPVWCGNHLLFSDIPQNRIVKLRLLREGPEVTTFRHPSGNSNGNTLDGSQRLLTCEHSARRVTRTEPDGTITVLAERYQGKRLNSPNDIVVRSDGSIYFTDPPYGLRNLTDWKELPFNGVYRLAPDGTLHLLVDDLDRPNGLAFSPDEKTLYVDDTQRRHIRAFDVNTDGSIKNGRVLIDMAIPEPGAPDGMKVDQKGNIYCTGGGGFWIIAPDGRCLAIVRPPELPANMAWGDADWRTLFLTARTSIYRIRMNVPGMPCRPPLFEEVADNIKLARQETEDHRELVQQESGECRTGYQVAAGELDDDSQQSARRNDTHRQSENSPAQPIYPPQVNRLNHRPQSRTDDGGNDDDRAHNEHEGNNIGDGLVVDKSEDGGQFLVEICRQHHADNHAQQ